MANFCTKHGVSLDENGRCPVCMADKSAGSAPTPAPAPAPRPVPPAPGPIPGPTPGPIPGPIPGPVPGPEHKKTGTNNTTITVNTSDFRKMWLGFKNRAGIGDPERNKNSAYEDGKLIVPEIIRANKDEKPIKQYTVAKLRKRILGIPYAKAIGRIELTNQRVIFRAPGTSPAGRTTLQHEFTIGEVAGIEARKEYIFDFWAFLIADFFLSLGAGMGVGTIFGLGQEMDFNFFAGFLGFLLGIVGLIPFFIMYKKWWLKLITCGVSLGSLATCITVAIETGNDFWAVFFIPLALLALATAIFSSAMFFIRPNLVMVIKTKATSPGVDIRRKKVGLLSFLGGSKEEDDHTGYTEIVPEPDAEISIKELGALIHDIQQLGDFSVDAWKDFSAK